MLLSPGLARLYSLSWHLRSHMFIFHYPAGSLHTFCSQWIVNLGRTTNFAWAFSTQSSGPPARHKPPASQLAAAFHASVASRRIDRLPSSTWQPTVLSSALPAGRQEASEADHTLRHEADRPLSIRSCVSASLIKTAVPMMVTLEVD